MKNTNTYSLFLLVAFLFWQTALTAQEQSYSWFDGENEQKITLLPELLAEFNQSGSIGSRDGQARMVSQMGAVRIYKISDPELIKANTNGKSPGSQGISPVFASGTGEKMALPGGILVALQSDWSAGKCESWINAHGSLVLQKLPISGNYYLISSGSGWASLEQANQLRNESGVLVAMPNWWKAVQAR
ncbi:MAG: hypothetical protein KDK39_08565 [Leptospiraceae bacterium]|nr:hypothetical protein [Leptospiraceae bacterium]